MDYPYYPERPELCPKCKRTGPVYVDVIAGQVTVKCLRMHHVIRHGPTKGAPWADRHSGAEARDLIERQGV